MNADRASKTARLIAAATVMRQHAEISVDSPPSGAAHWCEQFLATNRMDRLLLWSVRSVLGKALWQFIESITVPGIVSHWMRRKRAIEDLVRAAAAEGFTQLVVLGAGLDTLAFRLANEHLFETIISTDHPATLEVVRAAIVSNSDYSASASSNVARNGLCTDESQTRSLELLSMDLACDDACWILTNSRGFDETRSTVIVIEGVLMYLPEVAVADLLRSLAKVHTPRMRIVASWMNTTPGDPIGFVGQSRRIPEWLRRRGEPMLWSSTPVALPMFLAELRWVNARIIDIAEMPSLKSNASYGLKGEQLVVVERVGTKSL